MDDSLNPQETADLWWSTCESSLSTSIWKARSWINASMQSVHSPLVIAPTLHWELGSGSREWSARPREPGCIWLLHYRPFHWLGCTELMNWGSGQDHIIGRNEFLSQTSQEAIGSGWNQHEPWLTEEEGAVSGPVHEPAAGCRLRTWWSFRMLDQYTGEEPWIHREAYCCRQLVLMIGLVISVFLSRGNWHLRHNIFSIVYSSKPQEADLC